MKIEQGQSSILLSKDINGIITSFLPEESFLSNGTICKEWKRPKTTISSRKEACGSVEMIKEYFDNTISERKNDILERDIYWYGTMMQKASKDGKFQVMKKIYERHQQDNPERKFPWKIQGIFFHTLKYGNIEHIKWLVQKECVFYKLDGAGAALNGSLENIKFLHENKYDMGWAIQDSIRLGNLENVKWLIRQGYSINDCVKNTPLYFAAKGGSTEMMDWLIFKKGCGLHGGYKGAISSEKIETLQWLKDKGFELNSRVIPNRENLELMKWLVNNGREWDKTDFFSVAYKGHRKVMEFFHKKKCPFGMALDGALRNGNYDNFIWLVQKHCEVPDGTLNLAIRICNNVEILEWLRVRGFNYHPSSLNNAIKCRRSVGTLKWLIGIGFNFEQDTYKDAVRAGSKEETLSWLRENGCN